MIRNGPKADALHPWSVKIAVEQIPEAGLHQELEADASQRIALTRLAGIRDMPEVRAVFELRHAGRGRVHVTGKVIARVGQICVVTLDPIENIIDEPVDLLFAPEDQVQAIVKAMEDEAKTEGDMPDPPEVIVGGAIDLGKLATDVLILGINPYPRKPDVVFEPPAVADDPESHPFAALKALKGESEPKKSKNPKNK